MIPVDIAGAWKAVVHFIDFNRKFDAVIVQLG